MSFQYIDRMELMFSSKLAVMTTCAAIFICSSNALGQKEEPQKAFNFSDDFHSSSSEAKYKFKGPVEWKEGHVTLGNKSQLKFEPHTPGENPDILLDLNLPIPVEKEICFFKIKLGNKKGEALSIEVMRTMNNGSILDAVLLYQTSPGWFSEKKEPIRSYPFVGIQSGLWIMKIKNGLFQLNIPNCKTLKAHLPNLGMFFSPQYLSIEATNGSLELSKLEFKHVGNWVAPLASDPQWVKKLQQWGKLHMKVERTIENTIANKEAAKDEELENLRESLDLSKELFGDGHFMYIQELAFLALFLDDNTESEILFAKCKSKMNRLGLSGHPFMGEMFFYQSLRLTNKQNKQAIENCQNSIRIWKELYGTYSKKLIRPLKILASKQRDEGMDIAEQTLEKARFIESLPNSYERGDADSSYSILADNFSIFGKYDLAEKYIRDEIKVLTAFKPESSDLILAKGNLGAILDYANKKSESSRVLNDVVEESIDQFGEQSLPTCFVIKMRGTLLRHKGMLDDSEADLRHALKIAQNLEANSTNREKKKAIKLNNKIKFSLALVLSDMKKFHESKLLLDQLTKKNSVPPSLLLRSLGDVHIGLGKRTEAISYLERALEAANKENIPLVKPGMKKMILNDLGRIHRVKFQLDVAEGYLLQALEEPTVTDSAVEATTYQQLALLNATRGKYPQADLMMQRVLNIHSKKKLADSWYVDFLISYAELFAKQEKWQKSKEILKQIDSLSLSEKELVRLSEKHKYLSLKINVNSVINGIPPDIEELKRNVTLAERQFGKLHSNYRLDVRRLSSAYLMQGNASQAKKLMATVLPHDEASMTNIDALCFTEMSLIYFALGENQNAEVFLQKSIDIFENIFNLESFDSFEATFTDSGKLLVRELNSLACLQSLNGDSERAWDSFEKGNAIAIREALVKKINTDSKQSIKSRELWSEYVKNYDMYQLAIEQKDYLQIKKSLEDTQRARAALLSSQANSNEAFISGNHSKIRKIEEIHKAMSEDMAFVGVTGFGIPNGRSLMKAVVLRKGVKPTWIDVEVLPEKNFDQSGSLQQHNMESYVWNAIRAHLIKVDQDKIIKRLLWVGTPPQKIDILAQGSYAVTYIPSAAVFLTLKEWEKQSSDLPVKILAIGAPQYRDQIPTPIELENIPSQGAFVTKVLPNSQASLVGIKPYDVILSYNGVPVNSSTSLVKLTGSQSLNNKRKFSLDIIRSGKKIELNVPPGKLGIGVKSNPKEQLAMINKRLLPLHKYYSLRQENYPSHLGMDLELKYVREIASSQEHEVTIVNNQDATRNNVLNQLKAFKKTQAIVHVSAHGMSNSKEPFQSHIVLSPIVNNGNFDLNYSSGNLTAESILREVEIKSPLVFLSCCQSGVDAKGSLNNPMGFATAFIAAGARSVIVTRRNINDLVGYLFAKKFYHFYFGEDKPSVGKAFHATREWMRSASHQEIVEELPSKDSFSKLTKSRMNNHRGKEVLLSKEQYDPSAPRPLSDPIYWGSFVLIGLDN